jgi:hypothetical protein
MSNQTMDDQCWHYVYYSYEECGRGYIGKRTSKVPPNEDPYLGSFTDKTFKPTRKTVIATFESAEKAYEAELALHRLFKVDKEPHFANKVVLSSPRFCYIVKGRRKPRKGTIRGFNKDKKTLWKRAMQERLYAQSLPREEIEMWQHMLNLINEERDWLIAQGRADELITMYHFRCPYGNLYPFTDVGAFCGHSGLDRGKVDLLLKGDISRVEGWTIG